MRCLACFHIASFSLSKSQLEIAGFFNWNRMIYINNKDEIYVKTFWRAKYLKSIMINYGLVPSLDDTIEMMEVNIFNKLTDLHYGNEK